MDIKWNKELTKTSYQFLREAGYIPIADRQTGKQSYVYKLTANKYPRFHIYVEGEGDDFLELHLHLDQREHGWGEKLHDTDYKGEQVTAEANRLQRWLQHFSVHSVEGDKENSHKDDRGLLSKLFG